MSGTEPRMVVWTDHALAKAELLGIARADVEDAILTGHVQRLRNTGAADWRLRAAPITIAYNHPDADDLTALIVTLWRQG